MTEIKTAPVTAQHVPDKDQFRDEFGRGHVPGSFRVAEPDEDGEMSFWYCCPCGCRRISPLNVGKGFKPAGGPTWEWNGSLEAPTLTPSVHHIGHWHGHLKNGVWASC